MNTTSHLRFPCFLLDLAPRPIDASPPATVYPPVPNSRALSSVTEWSRGPRYLPGSIPLSYDSATIFSVRHLVVLPFDLDSRGTSECSFPARQIILCYFKETIRPSRWPMPSQVCHSLQRRNCLPLSFRLNFLHSAQMTLASDAADSREETPRMVR